MATLLAAGLAAGCSGLDTVDEACPSIRPGKAYSERTGAVIINEVAARGEPRDWFEMYNRSRVPVDLTGWHFSDDCARPGRAEFSRGTRIPGRGFLTVFVDERDPGFAFGRNEELVISDPSGAVVDRMSWSVEDTARGRSTGRSPDGAPTLARFLMPTPGAPNGPGRAFP